MANRFILLMLLISASSQAQIASWAEYKNDSIKLLWMPSSASTWKQGNETGYTLERIEIDKETQKNKKVLSQSIKPIPYISWKPKSKDEAYAKGAIYEKDLKVSSNEENLKEQDLANKQGFEHFLAIQIIFNNHDVATKMGLGFVDLGIEKNKSYSYRITTNGTIKDTAYFSISTFQETKLPKPPKLKTESREKSVIVSWPAQELTKDFVKYYVERTVDGKTWHKTSKEPIVYASTFKELFIFDSLHVNYRPVAYRLIAMNHFGRWTTSDFITKGFGGDFTPPEQPVITSAKHIKGHEVEIKWTQTPSGDMGGFFIARSNSLSGNYGKLNLLAPLNKNTRQFVDKYAELDGTNHYMVVAIDTAGNERASLPAYVTMLDTIPPLPPVKIVAESNPKGHVSIKWNANKEKDIKGYYVYWANDPNHEFSQITKTLCLDTTYADTITLNSLTKNVYYKVIAMDTHFQKSEFSDISICIRPDTIAPCVGLIVDIIVKDSSATISWQKSPSNDAAFYKLMRREKKENWQTVFASKDINTLNFTDNSLQTGHSYEYALKTVDHSMLESYLSPSKSALIPPRIEQLLTTNFKLSYLKEKTNSKVKLNWEVNPKIKKMIIYRANDKKKSFKIIGFSANGIYEDDNLELDTYLYKIQPILENGQYGILSKIETIKIK